MDAVGLLILFAVSITVFAVLTIYNVLRGVRVTREAIIWYFVVLFLTAIAGIIIGIAVGINML